MSLTPSAPPSKGRHLYKHGFSGTPLYGRWRRMVQRCTDPASKDFHHYGGRGIKVCERWRTFENFLADMGEPSSGQSLDRINADGDYEPGNCQWVDHSTQMKNTRSTRHVTLNGRTQCLKDWAMELGIDQSTLRYRLANWSVERALTSSRYRNNGKAC